jgi:hypothetical protein
MASYNSFKRVSSGAIVDGAVTSAKLALNAITSAKILNDAVTTAKINDGAVSSSKLSSSLDFSGKTITYRPLTNSDIDASAGIATSKISGLGTLATLNSVGASQITDGSIVNSKITSSTAMVGYSALASYTGRLSNGFLTFTFQNSPNTNVFQTRGDGNGGVRILKAGTVSMVFTQDIITSSSDSSYFTTYICRNGGTRITPQLIRNTGGQWDGYQVCGSFDCAVNDSIEIEFPSAPQSIDPWVWSQLSLMWVGYDI